MKGMFHYFSDGRLNLEGTVLPYYTAPKKMTEYTNDVDAFNLLIDNAVKYFVEEKGLDLSEYDADDNGYLDGLVIAVAPSGVETARLPVDFNSVRNSPKMEYNNTKIDRHVFVNIAYLEDHILAVHELAHTMGLKDLYRSDINAPYIDMSLQDVMQNWQIFCLDKFIKTYVSDKLNFNAYDKYLLNWSDTVILTNEDPVDDSSNSEKGVMELYATELLTDGSKEKPKTVVLVPDPDLFPYCEFFIAEYRSEGTALFNSFSRYEKQGPRGVIIWHCNTYLSFPFSLSGYSYYSDGENYLAPVYQSGKTPANRAYDETDISCEGDIFSSDSVGATSDFYGDVYTGAYLEVLSLDDEKATIKAGFREPDLRELTIEFDFLKTAISKFNSSGSLFQPIGSYTIKYGDKAVPRSDVKEVYQSLAENRTDGIGSSYNQKDNDDNSVQVGVYVNLSSGDGVWSLTFKDGGLIYNGKSIRETTSPILYIDSTKPEITLEGDNPQYITLGDNYTELGAQVTDNLDPDIQAGKLEGKLSIDASKVDTSKEGKYYVTYTATDHAGNTANSKIREVVVEKHTHSLEKTEAVSASCEKEGNSAYWTCSGCGNVFADEDATVPTTAEDRIISKLPHTPGEWETDTPAAVGSEGLKVKKCTVCKSELEREMIPALEPSPSPEPGNEPEPKPEPEPDITPEEWKNPFTDVDEDDWFYEAVKFACENGFMEGTEETLFSPELAESRAMLVTLLYRLEGEPREGGKVPFKDVGKNEWYTKAVIWAEKNGIINGNTENTFAPEEPVTREQMAVMLYRYARYKGMDVSGQAQLSLFADRDRISDYALPAMRWAVAEGLINGKENNRLDPKSGARRSELAAVLQRFCEKYR